MLKRCDIFNFIQVNRPIMYNKSISTHATRVATNNINQYCYYSTSSRDLNCIDRSKRCQYSVICYWTIHLISRQYYLFKNSVTISNCFDKQFNNRLITYTRYKKNYQFVYIFKNEISIHSENRTNSKINIFLQIDIPNLKALHIYGKSIWSRYLVYGVEVWAIYKLPTILIKLVSTSIYISSGRIKALGWKILEDI